MPTQFIPTGYGTIQVITDYGNQGEFTVEQARSQFGYTGGSGDRRTVAAGGTPPAVPAPIPAQSGGMSADARAQQRWDSGLREGPNPYPIGSPQNPAPQAPAPQNPAPPIIDIAKLPFKNSPAYKALPADLKALVDIGVRSFVGTPEQQAIFADALVRARDLADPYAKTQLTLGLGEFKSKIAFAQGDLERAHKVIQETRDQISQDVSASKEFLSLEQQAELSTQLRTYDEDLLTIADQAAEKGLTFATGYRSRALAEERRTAQYQDVVQSSKRTYNFKIKDLELRAARGDVDAANKLADVNARGSFNLEDIGRSAEKVLGTSRLGELPTNPDYVPATGVLGDVEQKRRQAIIDTASLSIPK